MVTTTTLVDIRFGSHLYGTQTPASDIDYKQVFVPSAADILLQKAPGTVSSSRAKARGVKNAAGDIDLEAYALHRYLELLTQGQTVALDMLWAPPTSFRSRPHPIWYEVMANRHRLVSKKASSFVGYCRTQANKYGIKGSRVSAVQAVVAYLDSAIACFGHLTKLGEADPWYSIPELIVRERLQHTAVVEIPQPGTDRAVKHLECCGRKVPFFATLKTAREVFGRVADAYGTRALAAARDEGVDYKALSHAVRVGREALELLGTGKITFPLPCAAEVLAIKTGHVPYAVIGPLIEDLLEQVEAAAQVSTQPDDVDHDFVRDLVVHAYGDSVDAHRGGAATELGAARGQIQRAATILQAAPDLNLGDYSRKQVGALVKSLSQAWAELTPGLYPESRAHATGEADNA